MGMKLPSSKVSILLVSVVVIVAAIVSINSYKERLAVGEIAEEDLADNAVLTIKRDTENDSTDTDSDGLRDWEEILWGTDPNNPDTDGDGTLDGSEVIDNRDPTIPGPNDTPTALRQAEIAESSAIYEGLPEGTLTDNLSINLAKNYFNLRGGNAYTAETQSELVGSISSDVDVLTQPEIKYNVSDISTTVSTEDTLRDYGNRLAEIQIRYMKVLGSIDNPDYDAYMRTITSTYFVYADELVTLPVPTSLVSVHIDIANSYYNIGLALQNLSNYSQDPVKALLAIRTYNAIQELQAENMITVANYLKENAILFDSEEPGDLWNNF